MCKDHFSQANCTRSEQKHTIQTLKIVSRVSHFWPTFMFTSGKFQCGLKTDNDSELDDFACYGSWNVTKVVSISVKGDGF